MKRKHAEGVVKEREIRMQPVFSSSFYKLISEYADEFGLSETRFVNKAVRQYAKELRRVRDSPLAKAIGENVAKQYNELQSSLTKKWWASMTPEERKARTKKANAARWPAKPKKTAKKEPE